MAPLRMDGTVGRSVGRSDVNGTGAWTATILSIAAVVFVAFSMVLVVPLCGSGKKDKGKGKSKSKGKTKKEDDDEVAPPGDEEANGENEDDMKKSGIKKSGKKGESVYAH